MEHRLAPTTTTCSSLLAGTITSTPAMGAQVQAPCTTACATLPAGTITGTLMGAQVALATSTIYIYFVQGGVDDLEYRVEVVRGRVVCGSH